MGKSGKKGRQKGEEPEMVSLNQRVRVYPDTDDETHGVVVEDFGDAAGYGVDLGEVHIADAARRWAVLLDDGTLVFVDTHQVTPE
jgi:hypothetical protein